MSKTLLSVVWALAALPLALGGVCCCVLEAHAAQAPAPSSCCATPAPADTAPHSDDDCKCPDRLAEVLASGAPTIPAVTTCVELLPALAPTAVARDVMIPNRHILSDRSGAPPGPSLHRTPVLRC